jgi:hypothetical protein
MSKTAEENAAEQESPHTPMTWEEFMSALRKLPQKALPETSASIIRELRGPLPDDDPDFVNVDRH